MLVLLSGIYMPTPSFLLKYQFKANGICSLVEQAKHNISYMSEGLLPPTQRFKVRHPSEY